MPTFNDQSSAGPERLMATEHSKFKRPTRQISSNRYQISSNICIYIYTLYHYLNVIFCRRRFFSVHGGFMDRRIPPRSESSIETSEVTHNSAISACSNAREWQMALALSQERERNWLGWIFISSSWYSMIQPFWECPSHDISWIPVIDPGAVF